MSSNTRSGRARRLPARADSPRPDAPGPFRRGRRARVATAGLLGLALTALTLSAVAPGPAGAATSNADAGSRATNGPAMNNPATNSPATGGFTQNAPGRDRRGDFPGSNPGGGVSGSFAVGVIVKRSTGTSAAQVSQVVGDAVAERLGSRTAGRVEIAAVTGRTRSYRTGVVPAAEAEQLAAAIAEEPGVEWAAPDLLNQIAENPWPVPVNDPHASKLRNLWDMRGANGDSLLTQLNPTPWPAGGVGTKAPALWPSTTGAGVTVAVIDTGVRPNHPDLAPNLLAGYDFVSPEQNGGLSNANDGNGRDPDASDPGDWQDGTQCGMGGGSRPSSWHGTHVAGTIAAVVNNGIGVAGVAPGAKILPVRVLGRCGGATSDIVSGMIWAAGGSVPGVPANPTPARILNMSLGGASATCNPLYADGISIVRSLGATVVVAAGNEGVGASTQSPGNCAGVVNVHAVSDYGDHASYSNYGPEIDISAPGGEAALEGIEIYSTLDAGTTTPTGPTYGYKAGTSMATPAVAGGAALLASLGTFTPDQMEAALRGAVMGFPTSAYFTNWGSACDTTQCGTGILDLTQVPAPTAPPVIAGSPTPGSTLTATPGSWIGPAATISVTWLSGGVVVGEGAAYTVTTADAGKPIQAVAHVVGGIFAPISRASAAVTVPARVASAVKVKVPKKARKGSRPKGKVVFTVGGARAAGTLKVTIKSGRKTTTLKIKVRASGKATFKLPKLKRKTKVLVAFAGSASVEPASSGWRTIKVKKRGRR